MIPDDVARAIIHGSPQGYDLGCRSKGGCANHGHPTLMTCFAAHHAAGSDWALGQLPRDQPIPKSARRLHHPRRKPPAATPATTEPSEKPATTHKHGTRHGYNRGCKTAEQCPGGEDGTTCAAAHRKYHRDYYARRRDAGNNQPIPHGTATGYAYGCHDRTTCPGGTDHPTCADAARAAERQRRSSHSRAAA